MSEPNVLLAFIELYRVAHARWVPASDMNEDGSITRLSINVDPAVGEEYRRHMWIYHASDAMGHSEWIRRAMLMEAVLVQQMPLYGFGGKWALLQNKANSFFVPGANQTAKEEIAVHSQEIVHFMEAAALVVDEVPDAAIDRIVEFAACTPEQFQADLAEVRKWLAAVKEAKAIMQAVQNGE